MKLYGLYSHTQKCLMAVEFKLDEDKNWVKMLVGWNPDNRDNPLWATHDIKLAEKVAGKDPCPIGNGDWGSLIWCDSKFTFTPGPLYGKLSVVDLENWSVSGGQCNWRAGNKTNKHMTNSLQLEISRITSEEAREETVKSRRRYAGETKRECLDSRLNYCYEAIKNHASSRKSSVKIGIRECSSVSRDPSLEGYAKKVNDEIFEEVIEQLIKDGYSVDDLEKDRTILVKW